MRPFFVVSLLCLSLNLQASPARFRTAEYALLPVLLAGNVGLLFASAPGSPNWKGGILFDDGARDLLRSPSKSGRETLALTSDLLLGAVVAYPIAVDALADSLLADKDGDRAAQMTLIAAQSFLLTALLRLTAETLIGRERPFARECAANPGYDDDCGQEASRTSFFSGHASMAFTGAGLVCSAREGWALAGGDAPCYAALGVASLVAVLRVMADRHYASDVIAGAAVGLASGYLLPKLLHYSDGRQEVVPTVSSRGIGLSWGFLL